jgi:hypothetical protein
MWGEPFSFWRNAGMGGYPGLRINALRTGWVARLQRSCVPTEKLLGSVIYLAQGFYESRHFMLLALGKGRDVIERFQVAHNDQHHGRSRNESGLFNAGDSRRSGHHAWALQTKNLAGIRGPAGHFRFWSEPANHGGRRANGGRQRLHGLQSFAHQFHAAAHLEFGEQ